MILAIRTDSDQAELGLVDASGRAVKYISWPAGRTLSAQLHQKLEELLVSSNTGLDKLEGLVFFEGPGSFTGLRVGAVVANTLATELGIGIAAGSGEKWIEQALQKLQKNPKKIILPNYGRPARTTRPRK